MKIRQNTDSVKEIKQFPVELEIPTF